VPVIGCSAETGEGLDAVLQADHACSLQPAQHATQGLWCRPDDPSQRQARQSVRKDDRMLPGLIAKTDQIEKDLYQTSGNLLSVSAGVSRFQPSHLRGDLGE